MRRVHAAFGCLGFSILFLSSAGCGGANSSPVGNNSGGTTPSITSINVACSPSSIQVNQTSKCAATVNGTGNFSSGVTWSVDNGEIDQSGNYTAPATPTTATVKAVSVQDATISGAAKVTVVATGSALSSLTFSPENVVSGNNSTGTITSAAAAPSGGITVMLSSSDNTVATVLASVTIPAGSTKITFTASSGNVSSAQTATITASAGTTVTATLTVNPTGTVNWSGGPGPAIPLTNQCFVGDFNGDGKSDLACYTGGSGIWNVALSTGTGWNSQYWNNGPSPAIPISAECFVGDFNGDGKSDIACYTDNGTDWDVALSIGSGWQNSIWSGGPQPLVPISTQCFSGDLTGNHKIDIACWTENDGISGI
jgi:FG-GAP-like repeat